jgi:CPA2 family monovalent cation:H+ antiporter-2
MADSTEVIRAARELNPGIHVLARASYLRGVDPLRQAGADTVYSGEAEVALAFVESILEIDRERARAHRVLTAGS